MNLVELNSVGSVIDLEELYIYPQLKNGMPDYGNGISLKYDEVSLEWYEELSDKDWDVVDTVLRENGMKMGDFDTCDDYNYGYGA